MSDEKPRKRAWGKTKNRGKRPPALEAVEDDVEILGEPVKRIKLSNDGEENAQHSIDLQHPELMSDSVLVKALTNIKVPIPIYSDGTPSRERLIHLFKKHVTPRPQRTRDSGWRKESGLNQIVPMDTDNLKVQDWSDSDGHSETTVSIIQRKRTLEDNDCTSLKKPSLQIPYKSLSKISVKDDHSTLPLTVQNDVSLASGKTPSRADKNMSTVPVDTLSHGSNTSSKVKITWP